MIERLLQGLLMVFIGIASVFFAGIYPSIMQRIRYKIFKREPDEKDEYWDAFRCVAGGIGAIIWGIGIWLGLLPFTP
ncbi:MAG: hypothetical protein EOP06_21405 [Proteobacteria bacterium]|nr:MAG: hypothetical protein EOP06_21405 [Pseudomonadota bacterium]